MPAFSKSPAVDPLETREALQALLSVSNDPIIPKSTCDNSPGHLARVSDVLAAQLEVFDRGDNIIEGACKGASIKLCYLKMYHLAGDDISSTEIKFKAAGGKALSVTMECVVTP